MSEARAAKAIAGRTGGNLHAPPPPDKPKEWKPLGVLQYKYNGGALEFRVVSVITWPQELIEDLHNKHGIAAVVWGK